LFQMIISVAPYVGRVDTMNHQHITAIITEL
jgi:hypothetical protein